MPVVAAVVGVQLPVVARGVVAAVSVQRRVQIRQLRRGGMRHAVHIGIDRMASRSGVDGDRDRPALRVGRDRSEGQRETWQDETRIGFDGAAVRTIDTARKRMIFRTFGASAFPPLTELARRPRQYSPLRSNTIGSVTSS